MGTDCFIKMKLYYIWQEQKKGYDTHSDMVVCAESEDDARQIHPYWPDPWTTGIFDNSTWCRSPGDVKVLYLGEAAESIKKGIICASFHAG